MINFPNTGIIIDTTLLPVSQTFPYLQQLDIIIRMEAALIGDGSVAKFALKNAIRTNQPASLIIRTTQDMIQDNYNGMADMLGGPLVEKIKNFEI